MKKIFILLGVFTTISISVLAEDLTQTALYKCMKKESLSLRKIVLKECGISESLAIEDDLSKKITATQKKCLDDNLKTNQEKYQSQINDIIKKCSNI